MSTKHIFYNMFDTHIAGGFSEVEIPSPIPNLEVKHFCADNTAGSPCGNVGRCQLLSFYSEASFISTLVGLYEAFFLAFFLQL